MGSIRTYRCIFINIYGYLSKFISYLILNHSFLYCCCPNFTISLNEHLKKLIIFFLSFLDNIIILNKEIKKRFGFMVLLNGTFAVDTFFCIGGLLVSYLTLKHLNATKKPNMVWMLLQRYLR